MEILCDGLRIKCEGKLEDIYHVHRPIIPRGTESIVIKCEWERTMYAIDLGDQRLSSLNLVDFGKIYLLNPHAFFAANPDFNKVKVCGDLYILALHSHLWFGDAPRPNSTTISFDEGPDYPVYEYDSRTPWFLVLPKLECTVMLDTDAYVDISATHTLLVPHLRPKYIKGNGLAMDAQVQEFTNGNVVVRNWPFRKECTTIDEFEKFYGTVWRYYGIQIPVRAKSAYSRPR